MSTLRRAAPVAAAVLVAAVGVDLAREPAHQISARLLIGAVHLHQRLYAPVLRRLGARCRFRPSCSHYAESVIRSFGAARGGALALWRVLRCGPWTPAGTYDPPPRPRQPASSRR